MKTHRFIGNFDLSQHTVSIRDTTLLHQMRDVLHFEAGEQVILGDGEGHEVTGQIRQLSADEILVAVQERVENTNEPKTKVTLYCSILKRENFELVVQKATEVGVKKIVPIITARTVKLNLNPERLKKIIHEAAEQSGRGVVPVLHAPMEFAEALKHPAKQEVKILFDSNGEPFEQIQPKVESGGIGIFIGPEGGWTPDEIEQAREADYIIANLGKLTLRGETAVIIASYIIIKRHNPT